MLAAIFLWLTRRAASLRRLLFRTFFEALARMSQRETSWTFMNYGYDPDPGEAPLVGLEEHEKAQRYCCGLYARALETLDVVGKDVVEVSAGRGGGAAYIARAMAPGTLVAVDIAPGAVSFCRKVHRHANLRFIQGDAEDLPLFDNTCDVLVNVEASFCYGDFHRFLAEVDRVLRPGGFFVFADLRTPEEWPHVLAGMSGRGLVVRQRCDITQNVLRALEKDSARREGMVRSASVWLRGAMRTFGGTVGSRIPRMLESRELVYLLIVLEKPPLETAVLNLASHVYNHAVAQAG